MHPIHKNQKGYAFVLTIMTFTIISLLALTLLTLTANGTTRNTNRQDLVQATDLADKGIDFIVEEIQTSLKEEIKQNGYTLNQFEVLLESTLNDAKYSCSKGIKIESDNGNYSHSCIQSSYKLSNTDKDRGKRVGVIKSTGFVNGKEKTTVTKIVFGTDIVPEQLNYALSSNKDGSISLYGGMDVIGDIRVSKNLVLHNEAFYSSQITGEFCSAKSTYATLKPYINSTEPKIVMQPNSNVYIRKKPYNNLWDLNEILDETKYKSNYHIYDATNPTLSNTLQSTLFNSNNVSVLTKNTEIELIDINKKFNENIYNVSSSNYRKVDGNLNLDYYNQNSNILKNLNKNNIVYVKGNLIISFPEDTNPANNIIYLRGKYYVEGNVYIKNATVYSDAIFYVKNETTIWNSFLNKYGENGTLILFGNGQIKFVNISPYKDKASDIKGFFYSNNLINLNGTVSNLKLQGGVSGQQIILTSIRGSSSIIGNLEEPLENQKMKKPRLTIEYDKKLVNTYISFHEIITEINEPEIVERNL